MEKIKVLKNMIFVEGYLKLGNIPVFPLLFFTTFCARITRWVASLGFAYFYEINIASVIPLSLLIKYSSKSLLPRIRHLVLEFDMIFRGANTKQWELACNLRFFMQECSVAN